MGVPQVRRMRQSALFAQRFRDAITPFRYSVRPRKFPGERLIGDVLSGTPRFSSSVCYGRNEHRAGIERFGRSALLRSLAVARTARNERLHTIALYMAERPWCASRNSDVSGTCVRGNRGFWRQQSW